MTAEKVTRFLAFRLGVRGELEFRVGVGEWWGRVLLGGWGSPLVQALSLRLSALASLGLARYKTRAPLARRLRASARENYLTDLR